MNFDPRDPFPLLLQPASPPLGPLPGVPDPCPRLGSYAEAQRHAAAADAWLGLNTEPTEREISAEPDRPIRQIAGTPGAGAIPGEAPRLWVGLPVQAMLTPYTELREMLARLQPRPGETIVDLGAGYGRLGFVIARHHPGVRFVGYELAAARVREGRRALAVWSATEGVSLEGIELLLVDLSRPEFRPEAAEIYFIYDYGTRAAIEKTLGDLRELAATRPLTVVGRGRASRDAIERGHPWLSQVEPPVHCANFSLYFTTPRARSCGQTP